MTPHMAQDFQSVIDMRNKAIPLIQRWYPNPRRSDSVSAAVKSDIAALLELGLLTAKSVVLFAFSH